MRKVFLYILSGIFTCCISACDKENELKPTEQIEYGFHVPQGEHDYDSRIVDWKDRCNFFILYDFSPRDIYWSVTGWREAKENVGTSSSYPWVAGIKAIVADQNYVGEQLDLLESQFLRFYPDTMLHRCMPLKVLLCSELNEINNQGVVTFAPFLNGYDYVAMNWGTNDILNMTVEDRNTFRVKANEVFLMRLKDNEKTQQTDDFYKETNYTDYVTQDNMYERGFLTPSQSQSTDWMRYVNAIISMTYEELTMPTSAGDTSNKGILNKECKDTKGLINKKYNIIINHYKANYGVDLQAIGNAKEI